MSRGAITHIIQYYVLFCAKIQGMFRVTERRLGDILWESALYRPVTVHVYIFPVQIQVSQCRHWCSVVASSLCLTLWKWRTTVSCWCDPLNDVLLIAWSVCECKVAFMTWQWLAAYSSVIHYNQKKGVQHYICIVVMFQQVLSVSVAEVVLFQSVMCSIILTTIRYDTRCYFNVRSKADIIKSA